MGYRIFADLNLHPRRPRRLIASKQFLEHKCDQTNPPFFYLAARLVTMSTTSSACQSLLVLSPCSSSPTLFNPEYCDSQTSVDSANTRGSPLELRSGSFDDLRQHQGAAANNTEITVIMPDANERVKIHCDQIAQFVAGYTHQSLQLSVFHLLLYLLANHTRDPAICINHLKILHMGKLYGVQTLSDLQQPQALLQQVCCQFATFELVYTTNLVSVPLALPVENLVVRTSNIVYPRRGSNSVTYTDAMLRIIRKSLRRKLSVTSMDRATQTVLRGSGTDVDDTDGCSKPRSWKRMFRKAGVAPRLVNVH